MNSTDCFLHLLKLSIHNKSLKSAICKNVDWNLIYEKSVSQNLTSVIYRIIKDIPFKKGGPNPELLKKWSDESFKLQYIQLQEQYYLAILIDELRNRNIEPCIFKGITLADLYPESLDRTSDCIDILINPEQLKQAEQVLFDVGFVEQEQTNLYDKTYLKDNAPVIKLHRKLWHESNEKLISILDLLDLDSQEKVIKVDVCNINLTTLGYTEHLIYLMYHIIKEIMYSGVSISHLCDITLYINNHYNNIDFVMFWEAMKMLSYDIFCENILYVCITKLDMIHDVLTPEKMNNISQEFANKILYNIMMSDTFDKKTNLILTLDGAMEERCENIVNVGSKSKTGSMSKRISINRRYN